MLTNLRKRGSDAMFRPGLLGCLLNPFYIARAGLWRSVAAHAPMLEGCLLDVGCGTQPYRLLFSVDRYVGVDISCTRSGIGKPVDVVYDGKRFPFSDASFDALLCNQVLEHVEDSNALFAEMARILKPGGLILITVPFVWDEHEQPHDYVRYTSFGLAAQVCRNGFRIRSQEKICTNLGVVFQLLNAYLYKISLRLPKPVRMLLMITLMFAVNILGILLGRILPDNQDLFLDQALLAEKPP